MNRYLSLAVLGFAGLGLAAPAESQAQPPVAVQVQPGPAGVLYQPGYTYVAPRYIASDWNGIAFQGKLGDVLVARNDS